jgi:DNA-binding transcriptional ArsR family regulator
MTRHDVFAALADPLRRRVLDRLRLRNGQTLTALGAGLGISRQAVSKHLKQLEAADLVMGVKRGRERLHFLNPVPIHAVAMRWLTRFDATPLDALYQFDEKA